MKRSCGGCTACCFVPVITELEKPAFQQCKHCVAGKGCGIYSSRPSVCQDYECEWKRGLGDESHRPDRLGIIVNTVYVVDLGVLAVISEAIEGMIKSPAAANVIGAVLDNGGVVFLQVFPTTRIEEQFIFPEGVSEAEQERFCEVATEQLQKSSSVPAPKS